VNAFLAQRRSEGSAEQARTAWVALRSFSTFLADQRIAHDNGDSILRRVRQPKVKDAARRALTDVEMWRVIDRAGSTSRHVRRDRAMVITLLGAGLRAGELIGLRLNDLDFDQRLMRVAGATSKSGRTREVTMVREVAAALDAYLADERPKADAEDEPLFVSKRGQALTRSGVTQLFDRLKVRTGIRDLCAHMCRHTWATNYRRSGSGDVFDLQGEGGWSDLRMVQRYSKARPLDERRRAPSPFSAARRTAEKRSSAQRGGLVVVARAAGQ
jgi:site-specific recombinase XerD